MSTFVLVLSVLRKLWRECLQQGLNPVTDLAGSLKLGMWMTMMLLLALGRSSCHPFQSRRAVAEDAIEVMLSSLLTVSTQSSRQICPHMLQDGIRTPKTSHKHSTTHITLCLRILGDDVGEQKA
eukprot:3266342-Amphidinium_carterae.1